MVGQGPRPAAIRGMAMPPVGRRSGGSGDSKSSAGETGGGSDDERPVMVMDDVHGVVLAHTIVVHADSGNASTCQLALRNVSGVFDAGGVSTCAWNPKNKKTEQTPKGG